MMQPGRQYNSGDARYGFNGKENDNEIKGVGNQQDYGMRIYDPRIAKFLSVDPLYKEFPWNSTYAFAENDVIRCVDLDGEEKSVKFIFYDPQNINRKMTNFYMVVPYSLLEPGAKYGPYGKAGTATFRYDMVSGKSEFVRMNYSEMLDDQVTYKNRQTVHSKEKGSPSASTPGVFADGWNGQTQPNTSSQGGSGGYGEDAGPIDYDNIEEDEENPDRDGFGPVDKSGNRTKKVGNYNIYRENRKNDTVLILKKSSASIDGGKADYIKDKKTKEYKEAVKDIKKIENESNKKP